MRVVATAALIMLTTPTLAQDRARPEIIRGLCQKDGCDEFAVLKVDRIRSDEEGSLFRTHIRTYHSSSQGRAEKGVDTGFVFCSPTKPIILAQSQGKVVRFQIATAPTQESRETIRQQANYYAMYFTICHGPEAGRAAVQDLQGVAQQFGYRSPLAKSVMVNFTSPEEVFSKPTRQVRREDESEVSRSLPRESRSGDLLPPRAIPQASQALPPQERWVERRFEDRRVERRPTGGDEIVIFREHRPAEEWPWYRQPERWIESVNPF